MQKGFGLIGILIVVGIIAVLGIGVLKTDYFGRNPFVPTNEEKSAIDMAEQMKDVMEQKNDNTVTSTVADETKDWKTYRNEKYGFEIEYPQDWNFKLYRGEDFSNKNTLMGVGLFKGTFSVDPPINLYMENESIDVIIKRAQANKNNKVSIVEVGNMEMLKTVFYSQDKSQVVSYVFSHNRLGVVCNFVGNLYTDEDVKIFERIVRSFKYTE